MQDSRRSKRKTVTIRKHDQVKEFKSKDVLESECYNDTKITASPLNESTIVEEMVMAESRATVIRAEIKELKKVLVDLCKKEDLTEEDRLMLKDTQSTVIFKIGELNEITHMLQKTLSLCDPSVKNYDKMFQMLRHRSKNLEIQ